MVSTAAGQFRLILDALEIQAFRQILAMPQITLPVAGVAYNVNASLGHDGISGVDAEVVDEPDPPVHLAGRSAPSARRPGGGPTLADRVRERAECDRDGDRGAGSAGHADHGGRDCGGPGGPALDTLPSTAPRFDDLCVLRSRRRCRGGSPRR
jgi:hypothetical protein